MADKATQDLHNAIDLLADELGNSPMIIERGSKEDFVLVSKAYFDMLRSKADAYDDLHRNPHDEAREQEGILAALQDAEK